MNVEAPEVMSTGAVSPTARAIPRMTAVASPDRQVGSTTRHTVDHWDAPITPWRQGTYELCGPKVQGNPEGYDGHVLVRHADAETVLLFDFPDPDFRDFEFVVGDLLRRRGWEGVVWHHPDGRMAKLKARDYEARP